MSAKLFGAVSGIHKSWMVTSEDCFKEYPGFLMIDPDECIDCAVCIPDCPVNAIYADTGTPEQFPLFSALNERLAKLWPTLSRHSTPLPTAGQWKNTTNKLASVDLDR